MTKHAIAAMVLLASAGVAFAAPPAAVPPEAAADALAASLASGSVPCDKPLRDGSCGASSTSRQLLPLAAGGSGPKTAPKPAKPIDLGVTFLVGSANLTEASKHWLDKVATSVKKPQYASSQFYVDGHTDRSGSCPANLKLSQDRARAAVEYLTAAGVDPARMQARGFGYEQLKSPAHPTSGVNRRVEVLPQATAPKLPEPTC